MIYPTLTINQDKSTTINIYDTDVNSNPLISIESNSDQNIASFYTLLALFINQYNNGWVEGYVTGLNDNINNIE